LRCKAEYAKKIKVITIVIVVAVIVIIITIIIIIKIITIITIIIIVKNDNVSNSKRPKTVQTRRSMLLHLETERGIHAEAEAQGHTSRLVVASIIRLIRVTFFPILLSIPLLLLSTPLLIYKYLELAHNTAALRINKRMKGKRKCATL
jgi:hypothetical protein